MPRVVDASSSLTSAENGVRAVRPVLIVVPWMRSRPHAPSWRNATPSARRVPGGSVVSGRRTATSDLDVVVLLHGAPAPYRASLRYAGWPVEMFVHTEATWHAYVGRELRERRSPLLWMCADGLLLFDTDGVGARLAAQARKLTAAGPHPVSEEEIDDRRYAITDLLDDLAGSSDPGECLFVTRPNWCGAPVSWHWPPAGRGVAAASGWHGALRRPRQGSAHASTTVCGRYWPGGLSPSRPSWTTYSGRSAAGCGSATSVPELPER